jgi:hypothetical protein
MTDERDRPSSVDPFLSDDPEALERERRRQQREERRRSRAENRRSLGQRVSGALDGAATKGREALEQTKERARSHEAPPSAPEPPSFRRPRPEPAVPPEPAAAAEAPAAAEPERYSAEEVMPRRRHRAGAADPTHAEAAAAPAGGEEQDWFVDPDADDGSPPPRVPPRREVATGDHPPLPPPSTPPPGSGKTVLFRRLIALALILLVAIAVYGLLTRGGSDAPPPSGPATLKTEDVTIPEGYTRSQIAEVAKDAGLSGNYEKATAKAPKGFDIAKSGAPKDASLEGFLFPATYELAKGASVDDLVKDQLNAFDDNIRQVDLKAAKKKKLTMYDVVTIASMIEREVMVPKERRLVSAVIYNRLAQGIPLGIDATLRYDLDNFDKPLTESDLQTDSPYNTRIVTGLPPSPIANPGLDALKAAADPANVDYLYYVVKPGTCGKHFFTADYDEFLAASDKYNSAREKQGGSPTDC